MKELKMLAVAWATNNFKHYPLGSEFILATDYLALLSLYMRMSPTKPTNLD